MTNAAAPVRAAVVSPYWTFWETSAGGSTLRDDRRALLADAVATLRDATASPCPRHSGQSRSPATDTPVEGTGSGSFEVVCQALLDSPESAATAADSVSGDLDVVLVVVTMAAPPTHGMAFLDRFEGVPLVVWSLQRSRNIRYGFDASDITSAGTAVGTPQLTNMLARSGRPHEIVVGSLDDAGTVQRVTTALRPAAMAGRLRRARIARVGEPPPGYLCVDTDPERLRSATGITQVRVSPADLRRRIQAVPTETLDGLAAAAESTTDVVLELGGDSGAGAGELAGAGSTSAGSDGAVGGPQVGGDSGAGSWSVAGRRSLAAAAALEALDDETGVAAGAMNCHVPELRFGDEVGISPCYGLGRETSRGIPWACAGDVLTAVAMLVGKRLGGAALYHEVEVIDFDTDEVAIANSGEHDLAWCPDSVRPRLQPNPWYADDPLTGACMWFELPPGPASLIGFTPHAAEPSGYRFIVAEGQITERSLPHSPTVGGVFRFAGDAGVAESWRAWAAAGVNHHSAASPGHLAGDVAAVAHHLGVGCIQVS